MSRVIIITNPRHDTTTEYLHSWCERIIELVTNLPDTVIHELQSSDVNQQLFTELVSAKKPNFVIFNGHGSNEEIFGYNLNILIKCNHNEHLLKDRIIHSLSCSSGNVLGPHCITVGASAFLGYKEDFKFAHYNKQTTEERKKDLLANLFLEPAYEVPLALIQGSTVGEAYDRSQKKSIENLRIMMTSKSTDATVLSSLLYHNFKHQVSLGNMQSTF